MSMEVPGGTLALAAWAMKPSEKHKSSVIDLIFLIEVTPRETPPECTSARACVLPVRAVPKVKGGVLPASLVWVVYWIFTAKMITADWLGVSVPTVAVMVPAVPFAGATIDPTVVLAGGIFR